MTKKEMYTMIREINADNADIVAFCDHEIELLGRKSNGIRKPTANQIKNEEYKKVILAYLQTHDKPMTITMMIQEIPELVNEKDEISNQKITRLVSAMYDKGNGTLNRVETKGRAYYTAK